MNKNIYLITSFLALLLLNSNSSALAEYNKAVISGFDHVGLAVKSLDLSAQFFIEKLSFKVVGEDPKYPAKFLNNGLITVTLWQTDRENTVEFNRKNNIGLHHLALSVPSSEALDQLYENIKEHPGLMIEFKPELAYGGPNRHMMVREPGGNRIEFIYRHKR